MAKIPYKLDPLVAKVIDKIATLPTITLKFGKRVPKKNREIIRKVFEKIRPEVESKLNIYLQQKITHE